MRGHATKYPQDPRGPRGPARSNEDVVSLRSRGSALGIAAVLALPIVAATSPAAQAVNAPSLQINSLTFPTTGALSLTATISVTYRCERGLQLVNLGENALTTVADFAVSQTNTAGTVNNPWIPNCDSTSHTTNLVALMGGPFTTGAGDANAVTLTGVKIAWYDDTHVRRDTQAVKYWRPCNPSSTQQCEAPV